MNRQPQLTGEASAPPEPGKPANALRILPLALTAVAMAGGCIAMLVFGLHPPLWLATLEAALLSGAALVYGFTACLPALPAWVWLRPVRGAFLVTLGIGAMYVPPQLLFSAFLIGWGVRLVWQSATEAVEPIRARIVRPGTAIIRRECSSGDLERLTKTEVLDVYR